MLASCTDGGVLVETAENSGNDMGQFAWLCVLSRQRQTMVAGVSRGANLHPEGAAAASGRPGIAVEGHAHAP